MKPRLFVFIVLTVAAGVAVFLTTRPKPAPAIKAASPAPPVATQAAPAPSSPTLPAVPPASDLSASPPAPEVPAPMPVATAPPVQGNPSAPPLTPDARIDPKQIAKDLDEISLSLRDYRTRMEENPIGNNAEITRALMGENPRNAQLAPPDTRLNGNGEMIDRWGTAYCFHQLSATKMEIHSAGPDKKRGTDDDIVHR